MESADILSNRTLIGGTPQEASLDIRRPILALFVLAVVALPFVPSPASADAARSFGSMAAMGDSITRGFNACGFYVDCPSRSWSTGTNTTVNSHYLRLRATEPSLVAYHDAKSPTSNVSGRSARTARRRARHGRR